MNDIEQLRRKEYLEERQLLATLEAEAYKNFDKTLLTFSSGAIALSVTFIEKFGYAIQISLLVLSWTFWLLSISFQLVSYIVSARTMKEELVILNERYSHPNDKERVNSLTGWPTCLNMGALSSFLVGTVLFLVFVFINL